MGGHLAPTALARGLNRLQPAQEFCFVVWIAEGLHRERSSYQNLPISVTCGSMRSAAAQSQDRWLNVGLAKVVAFEEKRFARDFG